MPTRLLLQTAILLLYTSAALAGEPPTEPIPRIDPGEHTATIGRIASDSAGRYLVTASEDKTARVWSLADGRLLNTLRIPVGLGDEGKLHAVALSPDGQTVALGGWARLGYEGVGMNNNIFLFDRPSGRLLRRLTGLPNVINHLAFSPDGRSLAATLGAGKGLRLFDVADGRLLAEDSAYGDPSYSVHFSPAASPSDARLVTTSWDGFVRLYRFDNRSLTLLAMREAPGGKEPTAARFSPDGKRIAVGFDDTPAVNVLKADDLTLDYSPDTAGVTVSLSSVAWSQQAEALLAGGSARALFESKEQVFVRRWTRQGKGEFADWPVAGDIITDLTPLPQGKLAFSSGAPSWGVVNPAGQRTLHHAPAVADFRNNLSGFTLSADGAQVRFGYENHGKAPAVFNSQRRALVAEKSLNAPVLKATGLVVTDWENTLAPKLNGAPLNLKSYEMSRSLALLPQGQGFALGTDALLRLFNRDGSQRWQQAAPDIVWAVNASQDGRWVVAAYGDGTIRWHRVSDGVEQLAFYPHSDQKRWVLWSPSGYYDSSPGADSLIGWHVNNGKGAAADFFPTSRFRDRFKRPDVLAQILNTQDEAEALRLANAETGGRRTQTVSIAQVLPPLVDLLSPSMDSPIKTNKVTLRYKVRTLSDAPVTGIKVRVNGQAVSAEHALKLVDSGDTREIEVTIPEQDSEISLFAENKNGVSVPASVWVRWAGKKTENATLFKPKLYMLAVGVSIYKNPGYNLGLAAKDATDFAALFQKQKGKLYSDVMVKLLTNEGANRDDVVDGLHWLKQQVTARDVGVVFLAGHGINDNTGSYYFLPHNADPTKLLRTAVAQNDIKMTLNSLAGKAMLFVDSGHSGNALGNTADALVNELASAENGVVVFSSSTGKQLSQENAAWGNGAFTKAVVEGLSGRADYSKTGKITHKGLALYVSERVKELTKGQQSPVSISPQGVTDFQIAVVGR